MISIEHSEYLLKIPKKVKLKGILEDQIEFQTNLPIQSYFILTSPEESEFSFLYDINQSSKNHFKLSLYLMCEDTKVGLLRVDYNGQHINPEGLIDTLPEKFHKYAGKFFEYDEPHIHYNVDGYKNLVWALPLENDLFEVKSLNNQNDVVSAILHFNKLINLETKFLTGTQFLDLH